MKRALLAAIVVAAAATVAPIAAQAHPAADQAVTVRLDLPVIFSDPTPHCPQGVATFSISSNGHSGQGINCLLDFAFVDCPHGVEALFCQTVSAVMTLQLPGGTIETDISIFEIATCADAGCLTLAVDQRWSGTVTGATGRFHGLEGGSVSGGGVAVIDAATFEFLSIDEVLLIEK
jgi:hypothetical protein